MKRFMWSFLALLIVACVGVYLAGGFECFAASPGTAGAAIPGDRTKAYITLGILIVAALLFVTEALPLPITAMLVPVGLSSTGVLTSKVAFSYFGDNTVVLFMAMFIIGESTFVTGFADRVGQMALKLSKGDMKKLLLFSMIAVGGLSTVLSNTGTTAVAVPMIMGMCASAKVAPSKILMPVAFASSLGGTVTLVGTPPNGIINSMLDQVGIPQFGFFEFGKFGLILFAVGMLYYWAFGYRLLPEDKGGEDHSFGSELKERRTAKMPYSMGIFAFVVIMMVTGALPLTTAAVLGACLVVATRCMTMKEAFHCIDWVTIFLFAALHVRRHAEVRGRRTGGERRSFQRVRADHADVRVLRAHHAAHQLHVQHSDRGPDGPAGPSHRRRRRHFAPAAHDGHLYVRFRLLPDPDRHASEYHRVDPRPLHLP